MKNKRREIPDGIDPRNNSWNDPNRDQKTKYPDTYCGKAVLMDGRWKAPVYDGYKSKGQRNVAQWWPLGGEETKKAAEGAGQAHVEELLKARGLWLEDSEVASRTLTAKAGRNKRAQYSLDQAMTEIERDAFAGLKKNTAENIARGCWVIRKYLEKDRLLVPMERLSHEEFERDIQLPIAQQDDLTRKTKKRYYQDARKVCRILREKFGLSRLFEQAVHTPRDLTGKDANERRFHDSEIAKMEEKIRAADPKVITETLEGIYYFGAGAMLQPVDVVFRRWDELDDINLQFLVGRRWKTNEQFFFATSDRIQAWLKRRRTKGGIWASGYIFPELLFSKQALNSGKCNIKVLTQKEKEACLDTATGRLTTCFNRFLQACEIKKPGVSYASFRHYNLPFLDSVNVSDRVRLEMAGHIDIKSLLNYGGRGAPWEEKRAAKELEAHYKNIGLGLEEKHILTLTELSEHTHQEVAKAVEPLRVGITQVQSGLKDSEEKAEARQEQVASLTEDARRAVERAMRRGMEELFRYLRASGILDVRFRPILENETKAAVYGLDLLMCSHEQSTADKILMLFCACDSELLSVLEPHLLNWCHKRRLEFHQGLRSFHDFGPPPATLQETLCLLFSEPLEKQINSNHEQKLQSLSAQQKCP